MILEFLNELTQSGYRIFSAEDAKEVGEVLSLKHTSVQYIIKSLIKQKMIRPLIRGVYAVEDHILAGAPLHKYEIAQYLAKEGSICCWSAMSTHELTDQILSTIFVLVPHTYDKNRCLYKYKIDGYDYVLIQTQVDHFWGMEYKRFGESKIKITDLERTLLDGLIRPNYCGGFREVMNAFLIAKEKIDIKKLLSYSQRSTTAVQKRLGYLMDSLGIVITAEMLGLASTIYFDKLDPSGARRGKQNKKWMLLENF